MSKRKHSRERRRRRFDNCCCEPVCCEPVCCEPVCCCEPVGNSCCGTGSIFGGMNSCITPIIFLLIACGSGLLNNNCSVLIILLFLLCGGCFGNLLGGDGGSY